VGENRPGGGGNIGAAAAAKSAPDGHDHPFRRADARRERDPCRPSKELDPVRGFRPIMLVATAQDVLLVPANSPFHTVKGADRLCPRRIPAN